MKNMSNSTNCLALTVRKEYRLTIVKNATIKSLKVISKVSFAVITLNLINLFV